MTADMAAVERMLKADTGKKKRNAPATQPGSQTLRGVPEEREVLGEEKRERPAPGSQEELMAMQAAWADPEFRKGFYDLYGDKLEAAGIECDGTFPGMETLNGIQVKQGDGPRGLTITPEPGFVIKTKTLETNEKVFINFCKSPKVRSFSREPDPNDETVERVRVPLSLGPARNDLDKNGEPCVVYDVVFNTEVMDQALHAKDFKDFLVGLGMGWVMEKGGGGLDVKNYTEVKLRNNYKGKFPAMQTVRAEALIEEVDPVDEGGNDGDGGGTPHYLNASSFSSTRAAAENSNYADSFRGAGGFHKEGKLPGYAKVEPVNCGVETPERRLYVDCEGGQQWAYQQGKEYQGEIRAFVVKVELPRMDNANDADLDVAEDSLSLEVAGKYELELDLPFSVDDNAADAAWDRQKRILTLTLPLKSYTAKAYAKHHEKIAAQYGKVDVEEEEEEEVEVEVDMKASEAAWAAAAASSKAAALETTSNEVEKEETENKTTPARWEGGGKTVQIEKAVEAEMVQKKREESEFEAALKRKLQKQSADAEAAAKKAAPRPIRGSKEEALAVEREKQGATVTNRVPFRCERCNWGAAATSIRKCRRCHWTEPGSKEEAEAWEQAKEHEKFRASRKMDEVGNVDETGGIEDEASVRAFKFKCRMAYELDDDSPGWLEAIREKHYGGPKTEKHKKFAETDLSKQIEDGKNELAGMSKEEAHKKEEQERLMPLPVKGLPHIEPLD